MADGVVASCPELTHLDFRLGGGIGLGVGTGRGSEMASMGKREKKKEWGRVREERRESRTKRRGGNMNNF